MGRRSKPGKASFGVSDRMLPVNLVLFPPFQQYKRSIVEFSQIVSDFGPENRRRVHQTGIT
jgi:hypothetical protein